MTFGTRKLHPSDLVYPSEVPGSSKFWIHTNCQNPAEHITTLRAMGRHANDFGIEIARFNPHVVAANPKLAAELVDAMNKAAAEKAAAKQT